MKKNKNKVLVLDIETSFIEMKHRSFSLYGNDVISHKGIVQDWYVHCVGFKWLGNKSTKVFSTHQDRKRFNKDHTDDSKVIKQFYDVLKKADLVIGHNLDKFDLKKLNTRFIKHGLDPIIMPPSVDTLKSARKYFKFTSNRLDFIADFLVGDCKMETEKGLWEKAFEGDFAATKRMAQYCRQDIVITEKVYEALKPYIFNHPTGDKIRSEALKRAMKCPKCGSHVKKKDGSQTISGTSYQYYKCKNCDYRYQGHVK